MSNTVFAEADIVTQPLHESKICFSIETAGNMLVRLQNANSFEKEITFLKEKNSELEKTIDDLEKIISLKDKEVESVNEAIKAQKELMNTQKEAYEEQIKNSKPSLIKQFGIVVGAILAGIGIGALL